MIRTEAIPVMDGLMIRVTGVCSGGRHEGQRCEGLGVSTLVVTARIEAFGVGAAMIDGIEQTFHEYPRFYDLILC